MSTGNPSGAPKVLKELSEEGLVDSQTNGAMAKDYSERLGKVDEVKKGLGDMDKDVDFSTFDVAGIVSTTLSKCKECVKPAQDALKTAPPPSEKTGFVSRDWESRMLDIALKALVNVAEAIQGASDEILAHAEKITGASPMSDGSRPLNTAAASAGGGGGGGYMPSYPASSSGGGGGYASPISTAGNYSPGPPARGDYKDYPGTPLVDSAIKEAFEYYLKEHVPADDPLRTNKAVHDAALQNWLDGYRVLTKRESDYNPNAMNNWDINAENGTPSGGLAQVIKPTFDSNHVNGTSTNMLDPVANIAASMEYVTKRYGVHPDGSNLAAEVQQAHPGASAKGY